jgi:hypothetical protein
MGRDEAPPFARGETYYNGGLIDPNDPLGLGGTNLEGKEFTFEPNSQDNFSGSYSNASTDPAGRPIRVKVVRNISGVNLKPGRLAHFSEATTAGAPLECRVDGYCKSVADRPAGIVDEFLPAAGVPNNDLFYLVIDGPTQVAQGATTAATLVIGSRLVPAAYGATAGDDLAGRVALQDLSGATTPLGNNIQNMVGFAATANSTAGSLVSAVVNLEW